MSPILKGVYNFTIVIYDQSQNYIIDGVIITILDLTKPVFGSVLEDIEFYENSEPKIINILPQDIYPSFYIIYMNDLEVQTEIWLDNELIFYTVSNLLQGTYNITVVIFDLSSNSATTTFFIETFDNIAPEIIYSPADQIILTTSSSNILVWKVFDNHPNAYTVSSNNQLLAASIWDNSQNITIIFDNFAVGRYNLTISITDDSNNLTTHSIIIDVEDPNITKTEEINVVFRTDYYEGDIDIYNGYWYDINQTAIENGTITISLFLNNVETYRRVSYTGADGSYELLLNYTSLLAGEYSLKITFEKKFYQEQILFTPVTIRRHSLVIKLQLSSELEQGKEYKIVAQVFYNNSHTFPGNRLNLNELTSRQGTVDGIRVFFTISVILDTGELQVYTKESLTVEGQAVSTLTVSETLHITQITSLSASVEDVININDIQVDIHSKDLPEIIDAPKSTIEKIFDFILDSLISIIISFIVIITILALYFVWKRSKTKENQRIALGLQQAETELNGIKSVNLILLQNMGGLPLYEAQYHDFGIDSFLIAGITSAMSAFLSELDNTELFGFEILDKQGMSITTHKREISIFLVISNIKLPLILLNQIGKAHEQIDNDFKSNFETHLTGTKALEVDKTNNIFTKHGLKINLLSKFKLNLKVIIKIQKNQSISRLVRHKLDVFHDFIPASGTGTTSLSEISEFLKSVSLDDDVIAKLILLMYNNNGLIFE